MKKVTDNLNLKLYNTKSFNMYFKNKSFAVFDIESTGLSPKTCSIILSGIMLHENEDFETIQFFANTLYDEAEVIKKTFDILKSVDYIITYNGKHFDIPFLLTRAEKLGIEVPTLPYNLDLYLVINGHSSLKEILPNLQQKSIELFMDVSDTRDDEISGKESVELYNNYLQTHSQDLENKIILHNHDDLIQLYKILPVLDKCDLHKAMYKLGFDVDNLRVSHIALNSRELRITGTQKNESIDYISFPTMEYPYSISMSKASRSFEITLPVEKEARSTYIDASALLNGQVDSIKKYPSYVNGYLVLSTNDIPNHLEINCFIYKLLKQIALKVY